MARIRSAMINETADELEQLRQYYKGKPASRRLLFLYVLKSDPKSTIASASERVGISPRRGRYWWDSYRKSGLQGILQRRSWGKDALLELDKDESYSGNSQIRKKRVTGDTADPVVAFINEMSSLVQSIDDQGVVEELKKTLLNYLPDVDYIVVNIRYGIDVHELESGPVHVLRQQVAEAALTGNVSSSSRDYLYTYKQLIEEGRQRGFPFDKYHYPPHGVDFYLDVGRRERSKHDIVDTYIGTLLLFRAISEEPMSQATADFIERMRPFISFVLTFIIAKRQLRQPGSGSMSKIIQQIATDAGLTLREQRVLTLIFNGSSYSEIAELLYLSLNTVQSHVKNIYTKTKVNKIGELFAKYVYHRQFDEKPEDDA